VVGTISGPSARSPSSRGNAGLGDEIKLTLEVIGQPFDPTSFDPALPIFRDDNLFDLPNAPTKFRALTTKLEQGNPRRGSARRPRHRVPRAVELIVWGVAVP